MKNLRFCFAFITLLAIISCSDNDADEEITIESPSLKTINSADITDNGNTYLGVDDIITYTITVKNTGDVLINDIEITANLSDLSGAALSLDIEPTFINADAGSISGILQINETATYTAAYTITQNDVDAGGITNSITASGITPLNVSVNDVSDDGIDEDGNTTDDPTSTILSNDAFDPTIIAEYHIINSEGNPTNKYFFDADGRFEELHTSSTKYLFAYDNSEKIINITTTDIDDVVIESQDVIYDSEGRITQIGTRHFEFVADENYFIETETYSIDGPYTYEDENGDIIEEYEIWYTKYYGSIGNYVNTLCYYSSIEQTNTTTGEFNEYGYCTNFESNDYVNNVGNICTDSDCVDFGYDNTINPLMGSTNLINVYGFIRLFPFGSQPSKLNILINANNLTLMDYSDPSYIVYSYEFNGNNLPVSGTRQYLDEVGPGEVNLYSRYYYQGDIIPD
ncbi:hypothetical protein [Psychroserpens sp. SPM9]|uniref:DUF7507 domain-containing protein n=1 Tax=Psychroserpens sp. SPM9 TaxID=2975598 RepID=UPI0021A4F522|nr:hypothetical protein [Psychroserpens sp. SPM9]MDG5492763.1 hypothetical protein [Psychroserpens sp. SPM9]